MGPRMARGVHPGAVVVDHGSEANVRITKENAENIALNMVGFESQSTTYEEDRLGNDVLISETYTIGGWLHSKDYGALDSLQKKLREEIVAVLVEVELPEGSHVAEVRRKYK